MSCLKKKKRVNKVKYVANSIRSTEKGNRTDEGPRPAKAWFSGHSARSPRVTGSPCAPPQFLILEREPIRMVSEIPII